MKVIFFITGFVDKTFPIISGSPLTMLKTPGGKPASSESEPNSRAVIGVNSDGFKITVHPAATAEDTFLVTIAKGKFHGVIAATTPIGFLMVKSFLPDSGDSKISLLILRACSADHSMKDAP